MCLGKKERTSSEGTEAVAPMLSFNVTTSRRYAFRTSASRCTNLSHCCRRVAATCSSLAPSSIAYDGRQLSWYLAPAVVEIKCNTTNTTAHRCNPRTFTGTQRAQHVPVYTYYSTTCMRFNRIDIHPTSRSSYTAELSYMYGYSFT